MILAGPITFSPEEQRAIVIVLIVAAVVVSAAIAAGIAVVVRAVLRRRGRRSEGVFGVCLVVGMGVQLGLLGAGVAVAQHEAGRYHPPEPTRIAPGTVELVNPPWLGVEADRRVITPIFVVPDDGATCEPLAEVELLSTTSSEEVVQVRLTVPESSTGCVFGSGDLELDLPEPLAGRDLVFVDDGDGARFRSWSGDYVRCDSPACPPPDWWAATSTTTP